MEETEEQNDQLNNKEGLIFKIFFIISALILIIVLAVSFAGYKNKEAITKDVYIDLSQEISINMTYELVPNKNIEDLKLSFSFYDKNNKFVTSITKEIGDVKKGVTYPVAINLLEFSSSDILKMNYVNVLVTNGTTNSWPIEKILIFVGLIICIIILLVVLYKTFKNKGNKNLQEGNVEYDNSKENKELEDN